jgi:hypothetical protein
MRLTSPLRLFRYLGAHFCGQDGASWRLTIHIRLAFFGFHFSSQQLYSSCFVGNHPRDARSSFTSLCSDGKTVWFYGNVEFNRSIQWILHKCPTANDVWRQFIEFCLHIYPVLFFHPRLHILQVVRKQNVLCLSFSPLRVWHVTYISPNLT